MNCIIITIGDELLIGQTLDTNSAWIGQNLTQLGIKIKRKLAIQDTSEEIISTIDSALLEAQLVLVTGGLGPTKDDITKKTLAEYFGVSLFENTEVLAHLKQLFDSRGRSNLFETNKPQAMIPENATVLMNLVGTAPGMLFERNGNWLISMPGVPSEMKYLMENEVIPRVKKHFTLPGIVFRTLVVTGIPESRLSIILHQFELSLPKEIKLAYLPDFNCIRLRLQITGENKDQIAVKLIPYWEELKLLCNPFLFIDEDIKPVHFIRKKIIEQNVSISFAESCTGGFIANCFIQEPGISKVLNGSIVTYSNDLKVKELHVEQSVIEEHGAVSEIVAHQMAEGVRKKFNSNIGISTTGIAGPDGGTDTKPVGLIYIGLSQENKETIVKKFQLFGSRIEFMERAAVCVSEMLNRAITTGD